MLLVIIIKKHGSKIVLSAVAVALAGTAYLNYRMVQPQQPVSELTLANIEALGSFMDADRWEGCDNHWDYVCIVEIFNPGYPGKPADGSGGPIIIGYPGIYM